MRLADYLHHMGISRREFARRTGLTPATVSRLCNGMQRPQLDTLLVIEAKSHGAVTINDFAEASSS